MARAAKKAAADSSTPKLNIIDFAPGDEANALSSAGAHGGRLEMVPVDALRVMPGFNIRVTDVPSYKAGLEELSRSIAAEGFYQSKPLAGFVGKEGDRDVIYVTDGHRRLAATKLAIENGAEVASLPVVLKPAGTTMRQLTIALKKENTGAALSMAENAVIAKRLIKDGLSEKEIAQALDFSERYVQDLQILIGSSKTVRDLVKRDKIAGTTAVLLLRKFRDKPGEAEAEMLRMVERAEARATARAARGEAATRPVRASAKDSTAGTKSGRVAVVPGEADDELDEAPGKLRAVTRQIKFEWAADVGHRFALTEIRAFAKLVGDSDWFDLDDNGTHATAKEPFSIKGVITRAAEPAKPKRGKRAQAAFEAAQEEEDGADIGVDVTAGEVPEDAAATAAEEEAETRELEHADL